MSRKAIPMIEVVFAQGSENVPLKSGSIASVRKGQHWPKTDQVVLLRPDLFTDDPRFGLVYTEAPPGHDAHLNELEPRVVADAEEASLDDEDLEDASAVPGRRRAARRSRTSADF